MLSFYNFFRENATWSINWFDGNFRKTANIASEFYRSNVFSFYFFRNTFTGGVYKPVTYDYIFHRTNKTRTNAWTNWFDLPFFKTRIFETLEEAADKVDETLKQDGLEVENTKSEENVDKSSSGIQKRSVKEKIISLSDHEGIESTIYFWV